MANTHSSHFVRTSSQCWTLASPTNLNPGATMTCMAWVKHSTTSIANALVVINGGHITSGADFRYGFFIQDTGDVACFINDVQTVFDTSLAASTWVHIAMIYDGGLAAGSRVKLMINGSVFGSGSNTQTAITSGGDGITIGTADTNRSQASSNRYFDGEIDDVRIWTRALGESEVTAIYNDGCDDTINGANLGGWWKFDNDATDSSGNGNDLGGGSLGTPTFTTDYAFSCPVAKKMLCLLGIGV